MAAEAKIKPKLIPTGGTGQAVPMVLGGHTDAIAVSGVYEYVRSGKLRLICQTGGVRNKEFPEIPTLRELGYDAETVALFGIIAPKGLPEQIKKKLEEAFTRAVHDPSFVQVVENAGFTLLYRNAEDFGKYIKEAYKNSEKQLRELGLGKFSKEKK
jgi:tripartite-type tricarboxylate transporter receptor subunit TctC